MQHPTLNRHAALWTSRTLLPVHGLRPCLRNSYLPGTTHVCQAAGDSKGSRSRSNKSSPSSSSSSGKGSSTRSNVWKNKSTGRAKAEPPKPASYITGPVQVELQEELEGTKFTEAPKWDTWCNHMSGEWVGVYSAFTPWAGLSEPVWMDDKGKYINTVLTRCLEERGQGLAGGDMDQPEDVLLRKLGRAVTPGPLKEIVLVASKPSVPSAAAPNQTADTPQEDEEPQEEEDSLEVEALTYNTQGVVVFDGGNYSAGPDYIGPPNFKILKEDAGDEDESQGTQQQQPNDGGEDEADGTSAAPTTTSVFETCLVDLPTMSRVRLKLTLRIGHNPDNDEVDVQILRMVLFREYWAAAPGMTRTVDIDTALSRLSGLPTKSEQQQQQQQQQQSSVSSADSSTSTQASASTAKKGSSRPSKKEAGSDDEEVMTIKKALRDPELLPRPQPQHWNGEWKVFTVGATSIEENDIMTGQPVVTWVYTTNEDRQSWSVPAGPPSGDEGGALWLPGGVVASFQMVDYSQQSQEGDGEEEDEDSQTLQHHHQPAGVDGKQLARGLRLGMSWALPIGNQVLSIERDYDGEGVLRGVRYSTAIKGGWSGGKM